MLHQEDLVMKFAPAIEDRNHGTYAVAAVTKPQLVWTQQTVKTYCVLYRIVEYVD
jgi:hypothetical protein